MTEPDADVVVVGCGPVGATLAILLAQSGHRVLVAERWTEPYPLPRAVHFDHEVARIFQACGLGATLASVTEPARVYEWRNGAGTTLLRFGRLADSASGWPESMMFNQPDIERLLDRRARELPEIDIRRGFRVTGLDIAETGVVVHSADGAPVTARFAVGCDGAGSTVRDRCNLGLVDLGYFYDWLIVDVVLDEDRVFDPVNVQICDPVRPTTAVSGGPGRRRWEFMRLPHETLEGLNDEGRAWELLEPWDVHPGNARLERHAVYTFNARYAERWRAGPVLLAGDAAHQMPPFAGQGMCAGIRDAANLAWKLDLVLRGCADDGLLDTYEQERLPSAKGAIDFSMELGQVICGADPAAAAARDEAMAAAIGDGLVDVPALPAIAEGLIDTGSSAAGHLFPQGHVGGLRFDDVHGAGWRLVTTDAAVAAAHPPARRWLESIGGQIVLVSATDDPYRLWFTDNPCSSALQRPDFHLFGTATGVDGTAAMIDRLRERLSGHCTNHEGAPS
jgi:2-polyprenyl-6-methoxyphenol hydroxylase-like FAD-dependent oxidoreductase